MDVGFKLLFYIPRGVVWLTKVMRKLEAYVILASFSLLRDAFSQTAREKEYLMAYASIPAVPMPPPGNHGAFAHVVSPGVGQSQILSRPGG